MFVPVACAQCGKPFQVPEAVVGNPTVCPWCRATVPALPVGGVVPSATPRVAAEPLSLDDEPQLLTPPPRRVRSRVGMIVLVVFLALAATAVTVGVLRYKQGHTVLSEWRPFTAPDGTCSVDLLGRPADEGEAGEKRYVSEGWYSGRRAWVGWRDITAAQAQLAGTKDGWVGLLPLFNAERDRLTAKYGGSVTKEATRPELPLTHEVRLDSPEGRVVERMIVTTGGPPRLYFVGMAGKNLDADGEDVRRLFESFRVNE
jgi:hypothetical protein